MVHRPGNSRGSLASKRSFSSSTYNGNDLDYYSPNPDQLESHLELDLEMDVMSLGHQDADRPFAPHPEGRSNGTSPTAGSYCGRAPVVVVEHVMEDDR